MFLLECDGQQILSRRTGAAKYSRLRLSKPHHGNDSLALSCDEGKNWALGSRGFIELIW